ncbi:MAG: CinA family nicotinamide mononucleotide deamidase-related protein [Chloroflexi bacterium]|nr:CinA family nicotinamide mononucleotide deamidase-related protein [Chloroflexota bacterium]
MRAEIITSGTELLLGDLVDTNAAYLSRQLRALGIDVHYRTTVGDNEQRTAEAISLAMRRADLVITTGGLGPTVDDVTRQAVARATGRPLALHPELLAAIEARFRSFGYRMTANNVQQAYIPQGAVAIENPVGTAPCFAVETPTGAVISLPGVPRELEYLMENAVIPYLRRRFGLHEVIKTRVLKTCAIGESAIDQQIADLMQTCNPTVGLNAHPGQTDVRITAKAASEEEADRLLAEMEAKIHERLGDSIYGTGTQTLEEVLLQWLQARGETVAVLETPTGGQLTQRLASVRGVAGFLGSIVAPADESLRALVPAWSETPDPCLSARAAADSVRERFGATYGLAIVPCAEGSAIAFSGPRGSGCQVVTRPSRDAFGRTWIVTTALNLLRRHILNQ